MKYRLWWKGKCTVYSFCILLHMTCDSLPQEINDQRQTDMSTAPNVWILAQRTYVSLKYMKIRKNSYLGQNSTSQHQMVVNSLQISFLGQFMKYFTYFVQKSIDYTKKRYDVIFYYFNGQNLNFYVFFSFSLPQKDEDEWSIFHKT